MTSRTGIWAAAVATLLASTPASAATEQRIVNIHGGACNARGGDIVHISAGVGNASTSKVLTVSCPITVTTRAQRAVLAAKGSSTCTTFDSTKRPTVHVYDRSTTLDVACTLYVLTDGNVVGATFTAKSSGSGAGVKKLTWNLPDDVEFVGPGTTLHLYVACNIPPKEADTSYVAGFSLPVCESNL